MKEKVLNALKTKYSNLGFGEKAFDGVADFLSKTIEKEEDIAEKVGGVEVLLKAFQGDIDKVRGEKSQLQKQLEELSKKEPNKEPAKEPVEKPEWVIALEEQNKTLVEIIQKLQSGETSKTRQQVLEEVLKGTSEGFGKLTKGSFEYLKNASEEDFSNWLNGVKENAKADLENQAAFTPRSGVYSKKEVSDDEIKSIAKVL